MTETQSEYRYTGNPAPVDTVPDLLRDIEKLAHDMRGMSDEQGVLRELGRRIPQWDARRSRLAEFYR